ncbi:MAG TPA: MlaD family protein [Baekduia sp.]|nr:MlaD family protein [Baekduia sp.]
MRAFLKRFEHVPGEYRPRPIRNGIIFLSVLAFGLYCGFTKSIPFLPKGGTEVVAHFDNATNATTGNQVRVRGVDVGQIEEIKRDPSGDGALVKMRIEEDGFEIKKDARAAIYWRTLLGRNMYVELDPGSKNAPPLGDDKIPLERTEVQVEFDQLLDSYDEDGRQGIRTFFQEGEDALEGDALGKAVSELAPGLKPVPHALRALRGTRPGDDLPQLVETGGETLDALARDEEALAGLLDNARLTVGVLAAHRNDIEAMLQRAPAAMRDTQTTMARLRQTLDVLDPVAQELRPGVRKLDEAAPPAERALRRLSAITPTALPALRDLRPALTQLRLASEQGAPFLNDLEPTLERLRTEIVPWLDERDATTELRNVEAIGPFFSVLADSSAQYDAFGHMQRFQAGQGERSIGPLPCKTGFFDPENPQERIACRTALTSVKALLRGGRLDGGAGKVPAKAARRAR